MNNVGINKDLAQQGGTRIWGKTKGQKTLSDSWSDRKERRAFSKSWEDQNNLGDSWSDKKEGSLLSNSWEDRNKFKQPSCGDAHSHSDTWGILMKRVISSRLLLVRMRNTNDKKVLDNAKYLKDTPWAKLDQEGPDIAWDMWGEGDGGERRNMDLSQGNRAKT